MAGEKIEALKGGQADVAKRERSSIEFPYGDLNDAVEVAKAIHANAGLSCTTDQLAAYLRQSATSGSFRLRTATARIFGLTENEQGSLTLTDIGRKMNDPSQEGTARVAAFMSVPLYKAIYEKYRGHMLPPRAALEREMANLGVSSKQADKARQAFERSAEQAGFFAHGTDRLVMPSGVSVAQQPKVTEKPQTQKIGGGSGGGFLHPFIQGLLDALPEPGTDWPTNERKKWLQTADHIFGLIYKGEGKSLDGE